MLPAAGQRFDVVHYLHPATAVGARITGDEIDVGAQQRARLPTVLARRALAFIVSLSLRTRVTSSGLAE